MARSTAQPAEDDVQKQHYLIHSRHVTPCGVPSCETCALHCMSVRRQIECHVQLPSQLKIIFNTLQAASNIYLLKMAQKWGHDEKIFRTYL